jgi:hypothetical protein
MCNANVSLHTFNFYSTENVFLFLPSAAHGHLSDAMCANCKFILFQIFIIMLFGVSFSSLILTFKEVSDNDDEEKRHIAK